jgi:hypothetical protein
VSGGPYEQVVYKPEGAHAHRTILLGAVHVSPTADISILCGVEVCKDGDTRWYRRGTTERWHVIDLALVSRRIPLRMDLDLGLLVRAPAPLGGVA